MFGTYMWETFGVYNPLPMFWVDVDKMEDSLDFPILVRVKIEPVENLCTKTILIYIKMIDFKYNNAKYIL